MIGRLALIACLASAAQAQVVDIHLRDGASGTPIAGAVVRLIRDTSIVTQALTSATGRATLKAQGAGTYRLRVNRIGYTAILTDTFSLAQDQVLREDLASTSTAVVLPDVAVQTKSECDAPSAAGAVAGEIWEQIRTALSANVLTDKWALPLQIKEFSRKVSLEGTAEKEVVTAAYVVHGPPFGSPPPATLVTKGFAYTDSGKMTFVAPDAALLLSDEFAATHCFRAVPGVNGAIGLAFEPTPRRRVGEVRGTLWIDRQSSELQYIEYAYTNLKVQLSDVGLGGRMDFHRLPTGAWIVSYWHIRMPRMDDPVMSYIERPSVQPHVAGYIEAGGRAEVAAGAAIYRATISGRVFDGTTSAPLADAVVRLQGDTAFAMTEADGRFTLSTATGGPRTIVVTHPKLGLMDDGSTQAIVLSVGDTTIVDVAVPTAQRFAREFCGPSNNSGIVGLTWVDGATSENLDVQVIWPISPTATGDERARSGPRGIYVFCDLPSGQPLTVRMKRGTTILTEVHAKLGVNDFQWVELKPPS